MPRRQDWCELCADDPAGQRWLCPNARNHPIVPTPRDRQIADFLAAERLSEQVDTCLRSGHLICSEDPDRCVRCGRILEEGLDYTEVDDDIPF